MTTQTQTVEVQNVSVSDHKTMKDLLVGRFKVLCNNPANHQELPLETVQKIADNLQAINPVYLRILNTSRSSAKYLLVADGFEIIQKQVEEAFNNEKFDKGSPVYGGTSYRIYIDNVLFDGGYPVECYQCSSVDEIPIRHIGWIGYAEN